MNTRKLKERPVSILDRPVSRYRRHIVAGRLYEITMRVARGLPFVPTETMNLLIASSMAQASFISKVKVSHFIWMTNHVHILLIAKDPESLSKFYGILSKVMTDHIKKLLSIPRLRLWEGRVGIIEILDPETAVERIAYFYANPVKAGMVASIEDYPGYSSHGVFKELSREKSVSVSDIKMIPWIRTKYIPPLQSRRISRLEDIQMVGHLMASAYYGNKFELLPNNWMKAFGIEDLSAPAWNERVAQAIARREAEALVEIKRKSRKILGKKALRRGKIMADHVPEKNGKRIFFLGEGVAQAFQSLKKLTIQCAELYWKYARNGILVRWPPGTFPPRYPVSACAI